MASASTLNTTYHQSDRPLQIRLLNWAGNQFKLDHLPGLELNEEPLLATAQRLTGLSDWGDESFRIPLRILLESLNTEANLTLVGRYFFRQYCLRLLVNRLKLQEDFKRYPEILQVPIHRPLFVVGLFRCGTTLLHNLLASDTSSRWLHVAEVLNPTPAPEQQTWDTDPRIQEAEKLLQFQNSLAPNHSTALQIDATRPAECSRLFEHDFIGHQFPFRANVKTYSKWLQGQNLINSYQSYRQQLQYLGWRWPGGHWLFKAPAHIFALDALLAVFPDACIVQLHRNLLEVLPSCCSLSAMGRTRFSDQVELKEVGSYWLNELATGMDRAMAVRDGAEAARFYDVNYVDLVKEPLKTVRQIYEYFGYPFSDRMEENLKQWIQENPQHKRGVHRYNLEQFGLRPEEVKERFANYRQRFNQDEAE